MQSVLLLSYIGLATMAVIWFIQPGMSAGKVRALGSEELISDLHDWPDAGMDVTADQRCEETSWTAVNAVSQGAAVRSGPELHQAAIAIAREHCAPAPSEATVTGQIAEGVAPLAEDKTSLRLAPGWATPALQIGSEGAPEWERANRPERTEQIVAASSHTPTQADVTRTRSRTLSVSNDTLRQAYDAMDANRDSVVSRSEWIAWEGGGLSRFLRFDVDDDERLSFAEYRHSVASRMRRAAAD